MMGGAAAGHEQRPGQEQSELGQGPVPQPLGGAGLNATLHSSSQDPASTSIAAAGAAGSFKLPSIARATDFSPAGAPATRPVGYVTAGAHPLNALAQGPTTHHHLNVTLGEDKFYLTAKEDNQHARLPNIANQTGSSSGLKTQLGNEYVGLMSKKSKVGSVDFNVQDSFALGGPAFNISGIRGGADGGKDVKMLTLDTDMQPRLRTLQDSDLRRPRASRSSNRAGLPPGGARHDGRLVASQQANAEGADAKKDTPGTTSHVRA